jgi:hypothetical protein
MALAPDPSLSFVSTRRKSYLVMEDAGVDAVASNVQFTLNPLDTPQSAPFGGAGLVAVNLKLAVSAAAPAPAAWVSD